MKQSDLKGKRVIVTGASKGLGSVCARALAEQGARLALIARTGDLLEELRKSLQQPDQHVAISADLTSTGEIHAAAGKARVFLGEVDVVLHVMGGGLGLRDPLLNAAGLETLFRLNVSAAAEINSILLPEMLRRKSGNLVHVCSIASDEATASVGYNTVKAALAAYVRSLGRETAGSGVVVTGIAPGGFYAPGNSWARLQSKSPEVVERFVEERLPRKFLGKAEELVPLILLLCSDAASMMAGCLVPIDAGEGRAYVR